MKTFLRIAVLASTGLWLQAHAASLDYYLHIDAIPGESHSSAHRNWIDIDSFSWGVSHPGGDPAAFMPYGWTQAVDRSTPYVFLAVASGDVFSNVTMDTQRSNDVQKVVFFSMSFDNAVFTSLQMNGGQDSIGVAGELAYRKITMTYRPQDPKGGYGPPIVAFWDLSNGGYDFSGDPRALEGMFLAQPTGIGNIPSVPEPQTWALMSLGLAALCGAARRRSRSAWVSGARSVGGRNRRPHS